MSGSTEGLYDKDYVEARTHGFDAWRAYVHRGRGRNAEDAGMARGGDRHPGQGRAGAGAENGARKRTYLAVGGMGNTFRRRGAQPDWQSVGRE